MKTKILTSFVLVALPALADIFVQPPSTTVSLGSPLVLDINVSGITDLYAFQFDIGFNPAMLAAVSVTEGSLFSSVGVFFSPGVIDNVGGSIVFIADSLSGPGPGISTDGTLAQIQFSSLSLGSSSVDLSNVLLLDSNLAGVSATVSGATANVVPEPGFWPIVAVLALGFGMRRLGTRGAQRPER